MADNKPVLSDREAGLLAALIGLVPSIGRWIESLAADDPASGKRRVSDVLSGGGASQAAADRLRRGEEG